MPKWRDPIQQTSGVVAGDVVYSLVALQLRFAHLKEWQVAEHTQKRLEAKNVFNVSLRA